MPDEIVYRPPNIRLADLTDAAVRHMTERDLEIIIYCAGRELDAQAVLDEVWLQERWYRLRDAPDP